ncbi:MAG TPA: segregation/condensation protein A [Phycisphaerales bacterium]|nr:segregation/condensation protein A [Phycisphaerales bacterium]
MTASSSEYTVRLDAFEGPLDLLLFLIRRAEVEVTDIPIAQITEQYLKHIEELANPTTGGRIDIERAGEFLVMAATLMEIKSRTLTPVQIGSAPVEGTVIDEGRPRAEEAPVDPRAELIHQLLEYKKFRDAGDRLNKSKHDWESMFPAAKAQAPKSEDPEAAPLPPEEITGPVDLDDIELIDLVEAFGRIIETVDLTRVGEHRVVMDDTPVELHAEDIVDRLRRHAEESLVAGGTEEMDFARIFERRSRSEMIGLFLAVLELVKQQRIRVRQQEDDLTGRRIVLRIAEAADAAGATGAGSVEVRAGAAEPAQEPPAT